MCRRVKYNCIYSLKDKYTISNLCSKVGVSRSSYYKWISKKCSMEEIELYNKIKEIQEKRHYTYGYRRMTIHLNKENNYIVNHKRVLRIMRKYNLLSRIRRKYSYKKHIIDYTYENKLGRKFKSKKPNQKWCTDISYIITKEGRLYLSVIKDLYDGSIVSYRYSRNMNLSLVTNMLKNALSNETINNTILHSDRGFQYTHRLYKEAVADSSIVLSMSRAGSPIDNAPIESFFSALKSECIYLLKPKNINEAKELIDNYIYYYNHDRIMLKHKMTPLEFRQQYT